MTAAIPMRRPVTPGCRSCDSVESMIRAGVPLAEVEQWLDFRDNRLPPADARRPVLAPLGICKGLTMRPTP